ncbi:hypothetical protein [Nocardia arizonensis]|uniref:hypothetical protein n=1 Tax=Nocardia arizonensis TaxID=1141647 RepID=UPI0006D00317|nr:hypothetical protein [Nocardia arizonensis]
MTDRVQRPNGWALVAPWPAGVLLALLNAEISAVTTPVFAVLATAYLVGAATVIRRAARAELWPAVVLVAVPAGLFVGAGYTGEPTAREPTGLLINTAVLFVVAVALAVAMIGLTWKLRSAPGASAAVPAVVLLTLGTGGFLLNLLARTAIVLTGASSQQLAVEDLHWSAAQYLRGLSGPVDFVGYTMVWLDLVQLAYVVSAFAGVAGAAVLATTASAVPRRAGTLLAGTACGLGATCVIAVVAAVALPRGTDVVPATVAFVLTIPFMATLLPAALGAALLAAPKTSDALQESK